MKPVASQHPHGMSVTQHSFVSQWIVPVALTVVKSEENLMGRIEAFADYQPGVPQCSGRLRCVIDEMMSSGWHGQAQRRHAGARRGRA
jgi:hypothetical protein